MSGAAKTLNLQEDLTSGALVGSWGKCTIARKGGSSNNREKAILNC